MGRVTWKLREETVKDYDKEMKRLYGQNNSVETVNEDGAYSNGSGEVSQDSGWMGTTEEVKTNNGDNAYPEFPDHIVIGTNTSVYVMMAGVLWPTRIIIEGRSVTL